MTVRVGVEGAAKGLDRAQLGKAIGQGLARGITQVAIESAAQKAGVDPLTTALTSRAITGALEGSLTSGPRVGDKAGGVMKGIFDAYTNSTLNTLSLGGAPEAGNPYSQAVYASKVKDFGDIVRQRGLSQALETYATGIFTRDSLDSIVRSGDEFGKQVQEKLKKGEYKEVPLKDGSKGKAMGFEPNRPTGIDKAKSAAVAKAIEDETLREAIKDVPYALIFDAQDNLMGIKEGPRYRQGKFGTLPGTDKVILTEGTDTQAIDDKTVTQTTMSGNKPSRVSVLTPEQEDLLKPVKYHTPLTLRPVDEKTPIKFNEKGEVIDGIWENEKTGSTLRFSNGVLDEAKWTYPSEPLEALLPSGERDSPSSQINRQADGSYTTKFNLGQGFQTLLREGNTLIQEMGKQGAMPMALDLLMPMNLPARVIATQVDATIQSAEDRYDFFKRAGYSDGDALAWSAFLTAGDVVGYTKLAEAATGIDTTTGQDLTPGERVARLGLGVVSAFGTAVGVAPLIDRATQLLPQVGVRFGPLTQQLGVLDDAGFARISSPAKVVARNNPKVFVPDEVVRNSTGPIDVFTAGEIRQQLGMQGPFKMPRVFDRLDETVPGDSALFRGAWGSTEKYTRTKSLARRWVVWHDQNQATYKGMLELDDDVRVFVSRTVKDGKPRGTQIYIDKFQEMLQSNKVRALTETVEALKPR